MGVDHVVDLSTGNITESVKGFLKAKKLRGVDVLYDPVGGKVTKESLKLLNWGAQILIIGFASGEVPVIPANIALVKVLLIRKRSYMWVQMLKLHASYNLNKYKNILLNKDL